MKKMMRFGVLAAMTAVLAGCGDGSFTDLQEYMDEVRSRPRGKIEPMPKEVVYEPFTYRATGLRSPFQPPLKLEQARQERGNTGVKPDETRVQEFLEGFNLESFVMVGTLANHKEGAYALVRGGDGVHRVKVGDYMGRNHGRIISITADAIELVEIVPDGEGGWLEQPHTLPLQERS